MHKAKSVPQGTSVAIYCRISIDRDGTKQSTKRQEADCRKLVESRGWHLHAVYTDRDTSAYTSVKRTEYERMMQDVRNGVVDAIVVWKLDRLTRRVVEIGRVLGALDASGAVLVSVNDSIDTSTPMGKAMVGVLASIAETESDNTSRRVQRAVQQSVERGDFPKTGSRCFGYTADGEVIPSEAAELRTMVEDFLEGTSYRQIAVRLNGRGVLTTRDNAWSGRSVGQLLASPRPAGFRDYGRQLVKGTWTPIIDERTFTRLRDAMARAKKPAQRANDLRHPYTGLIRCGLCGGRMAVMQWRQPSTGRQFPRYACVKNPGTINCGGVTITKDSVDRWLRWKLWDAVMHHHFPARSEFDAVEAEVIRLTHEIDELEHIRFVDGAVTHENYLKFRQEKADRLAVAQGRLRSKAIPHRKIFSMKWDEMDKWWVEAPIEERRALAREVIERVEILPAKRRGGNVFDHDRVNIVYRDNVASGDGEVTDS